MKKKFQKIHSKFSSKGFGHFGLEALNKSVYCLWARDYGVITSQQIEAGRRVIKKRIKRTGSLFVRVFAVSSRTEKPAGVRMGKGKGGRIRDMVVFVKPGKVIYELHGLNFLLSKIALVAASRKLGLTTRIGPMGDF
jgi:large subunit ribosomal protein L16